MSRARNLKPGFFRNPELSELTPLTRLFFQGIWCECDRRGIVEDRPKKLKADILPYDKANAEEMLKNLESSGFIQRYEVNGVRCIHVIKFLVHQNPHRDEKTNTLPAPCEHSVSTMQSQGKTGTNPEESLNTDSLNRIDETGMSEPDAVRVKPKSKPDLSGFAQFYEAYPKHQKRPEAENAWAKLKPDERQAAIEAISRQVSWPQMMGDPQYIPLPSSWLGSRRWEDEAPQITNGRASPPGKSRGMTNEEILAYGRGEFSEQGSDDESVIDAPGRVVERRDHPGENRGLSLGHR